LSERVKGKLRSFTPGEMARKQWILRLMKWDKEQEMARAGRDHSEPPEEAAAIQVVFRHGRVSLPRSGAAWHLETCLFAISVR